VRIYKQVRTLSLGGVLETLTPMHAVRMPKGVSATGALSETAKELLPGLVALLIVLAALSTPVLLILWRLHHSFERIRLP